MFVSQKSRRLSNEIKTPLCYIGLFISIESDILYLKVSERLTLNWYACEHLLNQNTGSEQPRT